ncbi:endonuclease/exonuclease/phosphatase family metal-dependent hydrolase [Yoonia maritima]|uniref:Endonuclease/exonuclease/phosphatase family metal-dependent hydrolase n=1 Tax=Yoonia maritima TaxID=1435347 RepID=A0A2T0W506_9RHOB|nr:endonuclease/exonuclease/phosphatase family protein [Yoonia maritima]PRY80555.1 endonuclease/exonuclease/phosphatase family metal-dependent hydrolase [Yoonia maritima]
MTTTHDLSVASYNIHKGIGTDRRRNLARTTAVIAEIGADILAIQEADTRFGSRKGLLDLDSIRRDLGLIAVPMDDVGDAHGWHGNLLLVRNALVQEVHQLMLPGLEPRGALVTDMMIAGRPLRVVNAHLGLLQASRTAQVRALLDKIRDLEGRPTLLMGDLNEWRGAGPAFQTLEKHFTFAQARPSFPSRYPLLALDRMMMSPHGALLDVAVHDSLLSRRASDHLPIKARLCFGPDHKVL